MIRVCVVCEGQTEVQFVKNCLAPYFQQHALHVFPTLLQAPSGAHRGGRVTVERLVRFISHQRHQCDRITTLVDFYGFQDRNERNRQELEQAILDGVLAKGGDPRFVLPYIQMHEFEGLLFANVQAFEWVVDGWSEPVHAQLTQVREAFATPEDINGGVGTAPSKRIFSIFGPDTYSKTEHGPLIAESIGIDVMRAQCPNFHAWLDRIAAWGQPV